MARYNFAPGDVVRLTDKISGIEEEHEDVITVSYDSQLNNTATIVRRIPARGVDVVYFEVDLAAPNFGRTEIAARDLTLIGKGAA